jgi:hypothetical protein
VGRSIEPKSLDVDNPTTEQVSGKMRSARRPTSTRPWSGA